MSGPVLLLGQPSAWPESDGQVLRTYISSGEDSRHEPFSEKTLLSRVMSNPHTGDPGFTWLVSKSLLSLLEFALPCSPTMELLVPPLDCHPPPAPSQASASDWESPPRSPASQAFGLN